MNKKVLFLVFMLSRAVGLFAVEAVIDGLLYDITMESKEAKVIKYKNDIHYSGDIVIPETIEYEGASYIVTKIGHGAFSYCRVNTVTIPKSITCIEDSAFCCSRQISSINIPQSVASIGDGAFYDCKKLNSVHISDLEVWCSVEFQGYLSNPLTIAHHLFMNGEEIKDLVIPNTVTSIGKNAFSGCSELKSITIPNGVTIIGEGSFSWCTGLTSIKIPNSVTIIGDIAFSGCQSLTAIDIPNSVESIGYGAFDECRGLTTITIPNSVKKIGNGAFSHCSALNSVHITDLEAWCSIEFGGYEANPLSDAHHLFLNGEEIQDLELPNDMTSIGNYVFAGFSGLSSITIPNNVRSIGIGTFIGCTGITTIAIPNSVTEIGEYAFENCSNLTSITLPKEIKRIKSSTFSGCSQLASIAIPNGVTRIDDYAFQHCSGLKTITIPNSVTRIGYSAFEFCNFNTIILGSGVKKIGGRAYAESPGLTDVYCYTEMVPEIDYDAFERTDYNKVTLHVPAGAIDQYKNTIIYPWSQFVNIVALSDDDPLPTSVILSSITRINEPNYYYTFEGIKVSNPKRGVYIIRMKNGKVKKVFVK